MTLIAIAGIKIRNDEDDIVVLVYTGAEFVEVIREQGKFGIQVGTMDHTITAEGIHDALRTKHK